jgi:hypothetical protein
MRLVCYGCGKYVSTDVSEDTIVRAALVCPECYPRMIRVDARTVMSDEEDLERAAKKVG